MNRVIGLNFNNSDFNHPFFIEMILFDETRNIFRSCMVKSQYPERESGLLSVQETEETVEDLNGRISHIVLSNKTKGYTSNQIVVSSGLFQAYVRGGGLNIRVQNNMIISREVLLPMFDNVDAYRFLKEKLGIYYSDDDLSIAIHHIGFYLKVFEPVMYNNMSIDNAIVFKLWIGGLYVEKNFWY